MLKENFIQMYPDFEHDFKECLKFTDIEIDGFQYRKNDVVIRFVVRNTLKPFNKELSHRSSYVYDFILSKMFNFDEEKSKLIKTFEEYKKSMRASLVYDVIEGSLNEEECEFVCTYIRDLKNTIITKENRIKELSDSLHRVNEYGARPLKPVRKR